MKRVTIAVVLTAFLLLQSVVLTTQHSSPVSAVEESINIRELAYTPHAAMNISSNADFALHGWNGSGTEGDPYTISGLSFNAGLCLWIENTTAYFSIENCYFTHDSIYGGTAIYIFNVTNGNIESCEFEAIYWGIDMANCNDTSIVSNTIRNVSEGIVVFRAYNFEVNSNAIENVSTGMEFYYTMDSTISHNLVHDCTWSGVQLGGGGDGSVFSNNEIYHVHDYFVMYGALFVSGENWIISENNIHDSWSGIRSDVFHVDSCNITDNSIENCNEAMYLVGDDLLIQDNEITNTTRGIILYDGDGVIFDSNSIEAEYEGITLYSSLHCTVYDNQMSAGGILIDGMSPSHYRHDFSGNTLDGQPIGYLLDEVDLEISETKYSQILLVNCTRVSIINQDLEETTYGVLIVYCTNCKISNSIISNNIIGGVRILDSQSVLVSGCSFYENGVTHFTPGAIGIFRSNETQILGNLIYHNNGSGILLSYSTFSLISNNLITNNSLYGIDIGSSSANNQIYGNAIGWNSEGNALDNGENNVWDNGGDMGNWWSDYLSTDSDVYEIDGRANSQDNYPREYDKWVLALPMAVGEIGLEIILIAAVGVAAILALIFLIVRRKRIA